MEHTLKINLIGDISVLFEQAKSKAAMVGVRLEGDVISGSFSGLGAEGRYIVNDVELEITMTKKPTMFPQAMVDAMIQKLFQ